MDFSRPHIHEESVACLSKIRYIPTSTNRNGSSSAFDEADDDDKKKNKKQLLDDQVVEAANRAAQELLLGPVVGQEQDNPPDYRLIDATLYPERMTPQSEIIRPGDLVVIFESFDNLNFVYAKSKEIFSNRNGHFHHDDFLGKPFGCKIRSRNNRGYGFCYLLKPTPELWARSLNHRTQIVHELDASMICFYLNLRPNMVVCETGTGSGAMSHAIMRTIAPKGQLHTFEFNALRAQQARQEFAKNGLSHLVTVYHKDVCGKAPVIPTTTTSTTKDSPEKGQEEKEQQQQQSTAKAGGQDASGGFGLAGQSVSAVFLDLPEPWLAVPHAAYCLKPNGRIASYSPCVEQTQRTVEAMTKAGFHTLKTMEFRLRENYVDEIDYEMPPKEKRPKMEPNPNYLGGRGNNKNNDTNNNNTENGGDGTSSLPIMSGEDTGAEADNEKSEVSETEGDQLSLATAGTAEGEPSSAAAAAALPTTSSTTVEPANNKSTPPTVSASSSTPSPSTPNNNASSPTGGGTNTTTNNNNNNSSQKRNRKVLVARPFVNMRGHTAFLTFATAGNTPQPDPNKQQR